MSRTTLILLLALAGGCAATAPRSTRKPLSYIDEDGYRVTCRMERSVGSNFPERICTRSAEPEVKPPGEAGPAAGPASGPAAH